MLTKHTILTAIRGSDTFRIFPGYLSNGHWIVCRAMAPTIADDWTPRLRGTTAIMRPDTHRWMSDQTAEKVVAPFAEHALRHGFGAEDSGRRQVLDTANPWTGKRWALAQYDPMDERGPRAVSIDERYVPIIETLRAEGHWIIAGRTGDGSTYVAAFDGVRFRAGKVEPSDCVALVLGFRD